MVPDRLSRRDALRLSGLALVGLAGCASKGSSDPDTPSPTAAEREYPNTVDDPETTSVRNPEGEPAVTSSAHDPERDYTSSGEKESSAGWEYEDWFVRSPSERDALEFAPGTTGVEATKDFLAGTDLSAETLFVRQYRVSSCVAVELDLIEWEEVDDGAFDVYLEFDDSSTDEDCEHATIHETEAPESKDVEAIVARIPADVEEVRGFSMLW